MSGRRRTSLALACGALALALAVACYHGAKFDWDRIDQIEEGVTTQAEILRWFGRPYRVEHLQNKEGAFLAWDYAYLPAKGEGATLRIVFDDQGIVRDVAFKRIYR